MGVNELFGMDDVGRGRACAHGVFPHHQKDHGGNDAQHGFAGVHGAKFAAGNATVQNVLEYLGAGGDDFFLVEGGDFGKVLGFAEDEFDDAAGRGFANVLPPPVHGLAQHFGVGAFKGAQLFLPTGKEFDDVFLNDGFEEFDFAWKVQEQGAFGDACTGRDFFGAGGSKTFFDK